MWRNAKDALILNEQISSNQKFYGTAKITDSLQKLYFTNISSSYHSIKEYIRKTNIKRRALNYFLRSNHGMLFAAFEKWKSLPPKENPEQSRILSKLDKALETIVKRKLKAGFEALRSIIEEDNEIKLEAMRRLFSITIHKQKNSFNTWKNIVNVEKNLESCKNIIFTFALLKQKIKENTTLFLTSDPDMKIKKDFIK